MELWVILNSLKPYTLGRKRKGHTFEQFSVYDSGTYFKPMFNVQFNESHVALSLVGVSIELLLSLVGVACLAFYKF